MPDLDEADAPSTGADRFHHPVDAVSRHAEHHINTPGDQALDQNVGSVAGHNWLPAKRKG
jgi:hypothetical protein